MKMRRSQLGFRQTNFRTMSWMRTARPPGEVCQVALVAVMDQERAPYNAGRLRSVLSP